MCLNCSGDIYSVLVLTVRMKACLTKEIYPGRAQYIAECPGRSSIITASRDTVYVFELFGRHIQCISFDSSYESLPDKQKYPGRA
jgi:hypothetical protein